MKRKTRVGLVTSGGDCQGLNAAIRGVGKALFQYVDNIEIFGMYDGYRGLIENDYKFMEPKDFSGIIAQGGTILGTSRQPFIPGKAIVDKEGKDVMPAMLDTYNRLNLDCLVVLGGNGTQKSAKLLHDAGMMSSPCPRPSTTTSTAPTRPSASSPPPTSPPTSSTTSTPPPWPTAGSSWWRSWAGTPGG